MGDALTPKIRGGLKHRLKGEFSARSCRVVLRGVVRELHLDFARFELRRIEGHHDRSVRCRIPEVFIDLQRPAGARVEVVGATVEGAAELPRVLHVTEVRLLGNGEALLEPPLLQMRKALGHLQMAMDSKRGRNYWRLRHSDRAD